MPHVVLLGDSIFDNSSYTRGEPDVITHLQRVLPGAWQATLLAVDGATTRGLPAQAARVPRDATHIIVSIGGNDALGQTDLLRTPVRSTAEALELFAERVEQFEQNYRAALEPVLALGRETVICTIYNGALEPDVAAIARTALALFNDAILRFASAHRLRTIELRQVCAERSDYANPIEPSGSGGLKIARAIADAVEASF